MSERTIAVPSRLAGYTVLLLAVLLVSACSSSASSSAAASASPSATAIAATCEQVSGVLSDGPDPDADPVGFAEAHMLAYCERLASGRAFIIGTTVPSRAFFPFYVMGLISIWPSAHALTAAGEKRIRRPMRR